MGDAVVSGSIVNCPCGVTCCCGLVSTEGVAGTAGTLAGIAEVDVDAKVAAPVSVAITDGCCCCTKLPLPLPALVALGALPRTPEHKGCETSEGWAECGDCLGDSGGGVAVVFDCAEVDLLLSDASDNPGKSPGPGTP